MVSDLLTAYRPTPGARDRKSVVGGITTREKREKLTFKESE